SRNTLKKPERSAHATSRQTRNKPSTDATQCTPYAAFSETCCVRRAVVAGRHQAFRNTIHAGQRGSFHSTGRVWARPDGSCVSGIGVTLCSLILRIQWSRRSSYLEYF